MRQAILAVRVPQNRARNIVIIVIHLLRLLFSTQINGLGNDDGLPRDRHDIVMDRHHLC
jgi:hypothetical protein